MCIYLQTHHSFHLLKRNISFYSIVVLIGILPILNYHYLWREQLSFTMYSGVTAETILYYDKNQADCLPQIAINQGYAVLLQTAITLDDWSMEELKVPVYGTPKIARQLQQKWCDCLGEYSFIALVQYERMDLKASDSKLFQCKTLIDKNIEED